MDGAGEPLEGILRGADRAGEDGMLDHRASGGSGASADSDSAEEEAMTRPVLLTAATALLLFAQQPDLAKLSADSEAAYRTWRERDAKIEFELRTVAKLLIDARIRKIAEDAQKLAIARHELEDGIYQVDKDSLDTLDKELALPVVDLEITAVKSHEVQLAGDAALLDKNIQVFSVDKDPQIQKVKAEMEKERAALKAVRDALAEQQKTLTAVKAVGDRGESVRAPAMARVAELMAAAKRDRDQTERESALWQTYYQALVRSSGPVGPDVSKTVVPVTPRENPASPPVNRPAETPVAPTPRVTAPSLDGSRWSGAWTFPQTNRMFSGEEPELLDVTVREFNGQLTGTLFARFKLGKGVARDPLLRLDFSGPLTARRSQKLVATTSDGMKGVVELLPGSAANLIEITWLLDPNPASRTLPKVRQGDVVLWRK